MIHIKHNGYHFTFHQVDSWWLLWENNCPIFLISSLFFFSRWLNQENESFFFYLMLWRSNVHMHILTAVDQFLIMELKLQKSRN